MRKIEYHALFKKDFKKIVKRGYEIRKLEEIIGLLANEQPLPPKNRDHSLHGDYEGARECHIAPDWLLVYSISGDNLTLYCMRTGTHSDLF